MTPPVNNRVVPDRYDGTVAVVTGGASGIGKAIALQLLAEGASVVVGDVDAHALATLEQETSGLVQTVQVDVTVEKQVEALTTAAINRFGRLDAGFNVAGIGGAGPLLTQSTEAWQRVLDICLNGLMFAVKYEAQAMVAQGIAGRIVNITSMNSTIPMYGGAAYCSAKAAADMLTRCAALELGEHGIGVNAVAPGLTRTPLTNDLFSNSDVEQAYLDRIVLGKPAEPEDMAAASLFLGSAAAHYITGVSLPVDGGWATTGYPDLRKLFA